MGLVQDLGVVVPEQGPLARLIAATASTRGGAWVFARTLHRTDRALLAVSRDRFLLSERLGELPTIMLTTTGARTGQPRTVPLLAIPLPAVPDGGDLAVIGSNFGRPNHPAWVHNLLADPRAIARREGRSVPVTAQEAIEADAERIWGLARSVYRGYDAYAARTSGRSIRVFVLRRESTTAGA